MFSFYTIWDIVPELGNLIQFDCGNGKKIYIGCLLSQWEYTLSLYQWYVRKPIASLSNIYFVLKKNTLATQIGL